MEFTASAAQCLHKAFCAHKLVYKLNEQRNTHGNLSWLRVRFSFGWKHENKNTNSVLATLHDPAQLPHSHLPLGVYPLHLLELLQPCKKRYAPPIALFELLPLIDTIVLDLTRVGGREDFQQHQVRTTYSRSPQDLSMPHKEGVGARDRCALWQVQGMHN